MCDLQCRVCSEPIEPEDLATLDGATDFVHEACRAKVIRRRQNLDYWGPILIVVFVFVVAALLFGWIK